MRVTCLAPAVLRLCIQHPAACNILKASKKLTSAHALFGRQCKDVCMCHVHNAVSPAVWCYRHCDLRSSTTAFLEKADVPHSA